MEEREAMRVFNMTDVQATLAAVCCLTVIFIVASEFTPVVYETTSNSQCGQQNEFENDQQLMIQASGFSNNYLLHNHASLSSTVGPLHVTVDLHS